MGHFFVLTLCSSRPGWSGLKFLLMSLRSELYCLANSKDLQMGDKLKCLRQVLGLREPPEQL